ncbi:MAG: hypothetical protein ACWGSQ_12415, partial [Longimicrobiales bacterium]
MNIPSSMMPPRTGALLLTCLAAVSSGCTDEATWPEAGESPAPESREDGWAVGSPESQGFDPRVITLLDQDLRTRRIEEIDALLIARKGVLVYEGYFDPATAVDARHQLNS